MMFLISKKTLHEFGKLFTCVTYIKIETSLLLLFSQGQDLIVTYSEELQKCIIGKTFFNKTFSRGDQIPYSCDPST